jgi:hypothetical protein
VEALGDGGLLVSLDNRDQVRPISEFLLSMQNSPQARDDQKRAILSLVLQLGEEKGGLRRFAQPISWPRTAFRCLYSDCNRKLRLSS